MSEVVLSQSCSELNNADSRDYIDVNKIMEQESEKSSQFYVDSFKAFAVKTAQSTLEMCRVVAEAKKYLTKDRFQTFCAEIGHEKEGGTIRKYIVIGNHYERFIKYVELLPNSWTSIYTITQLPPEAFDAFALTGNSMANMTGAQLKALMAPPASAEKSKANVGKSEPSQATAVDTSTDAASATEPQQQSQPIEQSNAAAESDDAANSANAAASAPAAPASAQLSVSATKSSMSVPAPDALGDESSATPSDHEFAKQATSKIVADARAASTANDADAEDAFVPYGIVLRFNSKPPEAAAQELTEMIISIKAKYCLDLEILSEELIAV